MVLFVLSNQFLYLYQYRRTDSTITTQSSTYLATTEALTVTEQLDTVNPAASFNKCF